MLANVRLDVCNPPVCHRRFWEDTPIPVWEKGAKAKAVGHCCPSRLLCVWIISDHTPKKENWQDDDGTPSGLG